MTELKKACALDLHSGGLLEADGHSAGQEAKQTSGFNTVSGTCIETRRAVSRSRFQGWSATSEGDNGILGVQLRSGANYINVMPAELLPAQRSCISS